MSKPLTHTVTGATGYTGRYIARFLLEEGHTVQTITGHPDRPSPFGDRVAIHPFNFDRPDLLRETLAGTDTLFNTYWIRVSHGGRTHARCVEETRILLDAAKDAGVRRIVHISVTNPDPNSHLPYFKGKGQLEDILSGLGISYAILRPTVLYSSEDILLNNIAWTLRKFPFVLLPGTGRYGIQPIFVEDLAQLAVEASRGHENIEVDAVGPDVFTYAGMVKMVRDKTGSKCVVVPSPKWLTYAAGRLLGIFLDDIVLTMDEIRGLSAGLLVSRSGAEPPAPTRLSEWLDQNAAGLGQRYASEVQRHYL